MRLSVFLFWAMQLAAASFVPEVSVSDVWVEVHLNSDSDVAELVFADASRVRYDYTDRRLSMITRLNSSNEEQYRQTIEWEEGRIVRQNGWFTTQYIYDEENRVIAKLNPWYQGTLEYDAQGLPCRVGDRLYTYDALGQITKEQGYFHAVYDDQCNLIELNGTSMQVDSQNRIVGRNYDAQGNLLKDGFVYDSANQLIQVGEERYIYDAYGRRVKKGNTTYLYLGFEEIGSFEDGRCKTLRIPGIGGPIAIEIDGKPYAPIIDAQGIIRKLIDPQSNTVYREIDYDIFGGSLTDAIPYAYRGKRYDPESGLIYFGRRYYDPALHRFLTHDPLGPIDHANLYQYVYNNPLLYWDPTGESFWGYMAGLCEIAAGGAIIAGGVSLELATFGGFTFGVGLTTSTGAALIGHGLATTTYHAQDIKLSDITWKNNESYPPKNLPEGKANNPKAGSRPPGAPLPIPTITSRDKLRQSSGALQKQIEQNRAPRSIDRADRGRGDYEKDHLHFKDGSALNYDGSWKHGGKQLTREEMQWINQNGWKVP